MWLLDRGWWCALNAKTTLSKLACGVAFTRTLKVRHHGFHEHTPAAATNPATRITPDIIQTNDLPTTPEWGRGVVPERQPGHYRCRIRLPAGAARKCFRRHAGGIERRQQIYRQGDCCGSRRRCLGFRNRKDAPRYCLGSGG